MSISLPQFYGARPTAPISAPTSDTVSASTPTNGGSKTTASDSTVAWSWVWLVGLLILARVIQEYAGDVV